MGEQSRQSQAKLGRAFLIHNVKNSLNYTSPDSMQALSELDGIQALDLEWCDYGVISRPGNGYSLI